MAEDEPRRGSIPWVGYHPSVEKPHQKPAYLPPGPGSPDQRDLYNSILAIATRFIPQEQTALSDRLRPPYASPVRGVEARTAPASRNLEVGFNRLPYSYQRALDAAPPSEVYAGEMPRGWTAKGFYAPTAVPKGLMADEPQTMAHELVHVLGDRRGKPWHGDTEEVLARRVAGNEPHPRQTRKMESEAEEADVALRKEYPEPVRGWLETIMSLIGVGR